MAQLEDSARALGQSVSFVRARTEAEIEAVFATLSERRVSALLVNTDPFFLARPALFVSLAARNRSGPARAQWHGIARTVERTTGSEMIRSNEQFGVSVAYSSAEPAHFPPIICSSRR